MLRGRFESPGELSPTELRSEYDALLVETIERAGKDAVVEQTEVDRATVDTLAAGESPDLTFDETTAILGVNEELPDADSIEAEARDILLMGMSIAVLDVEAIAAGLNDELEPKEIQQKVEGRFPMSLDEYAMLHQFIESEKR